jgi:hypothetical protein
MSYPDGAPKRTIDDWATAICSTIICGAALFLTIAPLFI